MATNHMPTQERLQGVAPPLCLRTCSLRCQARGLSGPRKTARSCMRVAPMQRALPAAPRTQSYCTCTTSSSMQMTPPGSFPPDPSPQQPCSARLSQASCAPTLSEKVLRSWNAQAVKVKGGRAKGRETWAPPRPREASLHRAPLPAPARPPLHAADQVPLCRQNHMQLLSPVRSGHSAGGRAAGETSAVFVARELDVDAAHSVPRRVRRETMPCQRAAQSRPPLAAVSGRALAHATGRDCHANPVLVKGRAKATRLGPGTEASHLARSKVPQSVGHHQFGMPGRGTCDDWLVMEADPRAPCWAIAGLWALHLLHEIDIRDVGRVHPRVLEQPLSTLTRCSLVELHNDQQNRVTWPVPRGRRLCKMACCEASTQHPWPVGGSSSHAHTRRPSLRLASFFFSRHHSCHGNRK
jgi:hypothetical protein